MWLWRRIRDTRRKRKPIAISDRNVAETFAAPQLTLLEAHMLSAGALPRRNVEAENAKAEQRESTLPAHFTALLSVEPAREHAIPPRHAKSGRWEDHHEFHPQHKKPSRSSFGVHCPDPPLALICPECEHRQEPLTGGGLSLFGGGGRRRCGYCGVVLHLHGSRILWWR